MQSKDIKQSNCWKRKSYLQNHNLAYASMCTFNQFPDHEEMLPPLGELPHIMSHYKPNFINGL